MAATDQTYRSQRALDIVFGASCILMLISIVWMFAQDYFRDYKVEQREYRDVETALAERAMLNLIPNEETMKAAAQKLEAAIDARNKKEKELRPKIEALMPKRVKSESKAQDFKADLDSQISFYNEDVDKERQKKARERLERINDLKQKLKEANLEVDAVNRELDALKAEEKEVITEAVKAEDELKELTARFDQFAKLTAQKKWKLGDSIRTLPVLDAFASPIKIQQTTLETLPIDYNFKFVTRYDRCTSCHLGIQEPKFNKEALVNLQLTGDEEAGLQKNLDHARKLIRERRGILKQLETSFDESDIPSKVHSLKLGQDRINEFSAHPRLDLFVAAGSPHPAEKFGCTICHAGQGGATDFLGASHTPKDFLVEKAWKNEKGWTPNHYWDFPMQPQRFLESSCLKCHHQVTDLLPEGNKIEYRRQTRIETKDKKIEKIPQDVKVDTPGVKVTRGYNLVREFGCFGCHEIFGTKGGRPVGPDLRLEPSPPLEALTPEARAKLLADPANPPGAMRKVGPSLRRLDDKTNEAWVRKWIHNPRGFRPDTKMPHFYGLSNNDALTLAGTSQEHFPTAEIHAIAFYLFRKSGAYLESKDVAKLPTPELDPKYQEDKTRGRQLFTERGCLACHIHQGTTQPPNPVVSEAHYGPNLSRLAAKLGDKPGDDKARRWLIQWLKNPHFLNPRTFMPVTFLKDDEAADIAAWLLDQPVEKWDDRDVAAPDPKAFADLARVHLLKSMTPYEVDELFKKDLPADRLLDADDRSLSRGLDAQGRLKLYIGKKAVNQLGCFGCHDIPGFEAAKPIGTPLSDWGKKDPERLAFEDITAYVQKNYHLVDRPLDEKGHGHALKDGRQPYERFYFEALEHQKREGFLHQKLREPRSFDYHRLRTWDERLRMPQFKFARGEAKPLDDQETPEQAELRAEAEAREAVMTFILGLLSEPIPLKYLYDPAPDRLAEVKGKHVLDKFNCAGCHQLRSGIYDFSTAPRMVDVDGKPEAKRETLDELESAYNRIVKGEAFKGDFSSAFRPHNAWTGQLSANPDRLEAHGIAGEQVEESFKFRLTQALRFNAPKDLDLPAAERDKKALDIPAGETLALPAPDLLFRGDSQGGTFTELLAPYLVALKREKLDTDPNARAGLPPPLLREGEKVQPSWLFQFLRDPYKIREVTVLRMPRFNMSEEEAKALVNYFAAVDRMSNPAVGLSYPYLAVPQRDEGFLAAQTALYFDKLDKEKLLGPRLGELRDIWDLLLRERLDDLDAEVKAAKKAVDEAKEADKKSAQQRLEALLAKKKQLEDESGRKDKEAAFRKEMRERWEKTEAYGTDGYRLIANNQTCINCHAVGKWGPEKPTAPALDRDFDRLRPDWTVRWIASPQRLLIFPSGFHPMPQVFPNGESKYQEYFAGKSLKQAEAARDVLMIFPKVSAIPENRKYVPPAGASQ